jgi:hypothetical protein
MTVIKCSLTTMQKDPCAFLSVTETCQKGLNS